MDFEHKQLALIKQRMKDAGIPDSDISDLVRPLQAELERRVCGLVWHHEGATTKLIDSFEGKLPVIIPRPQYNIIPNAQGTDHVLLEGENLLALIAMQYTHIDGDGCGTIDAIYIDPPYNTGSVTFAYNDKFEKSEWLSMMAARLNLAKNLLKNDGIIFVQIDDSYQAELKLLLNDIFGPDNYIDTIIVEMSNTGGMKVGAAKRGTITKNCEFIHVFGKSNGAKTCTRTPLYDSVQGYDTHFNLVKLDSCKIAKLGEFLYQSEAIREEFSRFGVKPKNNAYSINEFAKYFDYSELFQQFVIDNIENICRARTEIPSLPDGIPVYYGQWTYHFSGKRNEPYFLTLDEKGNMVQLVPMSLNYRQTDDFKPGYGRSVIRGDLWKGFWLDSGNLSKEGGVDFKNGKKPKRLIKQLMKWLNRPNAVILDFFAGSGTTGQAVLELNNEDGGHRQFILCTNNELGKDAVKAAKKAGATEGSEEWESFGVCHAVTYPRIKTVITGIRKDGTQYSDGFPNDNLRYFSVSNDITEAPVKEITRNSLAKQATSYIALKENIFNVAEGKHYHMLSNSDTEIMVVLDPYMDEFDVEVEYGDAFTKENRKVYCATASRFEKGGVQYIPYPDEVLDVLKAAKKRVRRSV